MKAPVEFCLLAILMLFGDSRLMSADVMPVVLGVFTDFSGRSGEFDRSISLAGKGACAAIV